MIGHLFDRISQDFEEISEDFEGFSDLRDLSALAYRLLSVLENM
jgi:hypothetical protein